MFCFPMEVSQGSAFPQTFSDTCYSQALGCTGSWGQCQPMEAGPGTPKAQRGKAAHTHKNTGFWGGKGIPTMKSQFRGKGARPPAYPGS